MYLPESWVNDYFVMFVNNGCTSFVQLLCKNAVPLYSFRESKVPFLIISGISTQINVISVPEKHNLKVCIKKRRNTIEIFHQ